MVHVNDDDVDNYVTGMLNDVGVLPAFLNFLNFHNSPQLIYVTT
jgi:hypothetical protein